MLKLPVTALPAALIMPESEPDEPKLRGAKTFQGSGSLMHYKDRN
eukprot:SAG31_NODE_954_length_10804_cov_3.240355_3_plen_45_part_00